jgi:hypothetical protein
MGTLLSSDSIFIAAKLVAGGSIRRNKTMRKTILLTVFLVWSTVAQAQERYTENTLKISAGSESSAVPAATIEDLSWLAGHWTGQNADQLSEEIWSPPKNGAMMGMYRLLRKNRTVFYELMTFVQEKGTLVLRIKHFHSNLKGWEEKDKTNDFRFIAKKEGAFYFEGMTFKPQGKNALLIFVATRSKDGTVSEEKYTYKRLNTLK